MRDQTVPKQKKTKKHIVTEAVAVDTNKNDLSTYTLLFIRMSFSFQDEFLVFGYDLFLS